jgi:hypothetical protein
MSTNQDQNLITPEHPSQVAAELSSEALDHVTGGALNAYKFATPLLPAVQSTPDLALKNSVKGE